MGGVTVLALLVKMGDCPLKAGFWIKTSDSYDVLSNSDHGMLDPNSGYKSLAFPSSHTHGQNLLAHSGFREEGHTYKDSKKASSALSNNKR